METSYNNSYNKLKTFLLASFTKCWNKENFYHDLNDSKRYKKYSHVASDLKIQKIFLSH